MIVLMPAAYGLPRNTAINYGAQGFPPWVYELCDRYDLKASTYPGHQANQRPDIGAAPNPQGQNRGIDWAGHPTAMLDFARWLRDTKPPGLEMVIYQDPRTGERVGFPTWVDYGGDYGGHTDHVHTRQSQALTAETTEPVDNRTRYVRAIIAEGRRRGISARGIQIALSVALVESNMKMYANSSVPQSLNLPHDAVGSDHDSLGLFQQRCPMWGDAETLMDATLSAGLFYDHLVKFDYNSTKQSPGHFAYLVQRCAEEYAYRYDERFDEAVALYNSNVFKPKDEGFLMALTDQQQQEIYTALCGPRSSRSPLHKPGEGTIGNIEDLEANTDGSVHILVQYLLGVILRSPRTLEELRAVAASTDPNQSGGRDIAQAMLNLIELRDQAPAGATNVVVAQAPISNPVVPQQVSAPTTGGALGEDFGKLHGQLSSLTDALGELSTAFLGKK